MPNRHLPFRGLAAMALMTALAACSSGATAPTSATGGGSTAGSAATGAAPPGAAGCSNPLGGTVGAAGGPLASVVGAAICGMANIQPCSMLKQADVQALFSVPLAPIQSDLMGSCTWPLSDPDKGDGLDVVVNVGHGEASVDQDMGASGGDLTPISGIGDHASWALIGGYFPHLGAVKGNATCELTIGGGSGQTSAHTTGKGVFAKIDDAALPGFMQQLGALCNEIFAGLGA